jgi:hypothetical protein
MGWLDAIAWFFGGAFLANFVPHFVAGVSGRQFQSPFAKPPGVGLSSSTLNVAWSLFNLLVAWLLLAKVGSFDLREPLHALVAGIGFGLMALLLGFSFGRINGGNKP